MIQSSDPVIFVAGTDKPTYSYKTHVVKLGEWFLV